MAVQGLHRFLYGIVFIIAIALFMGFFWDVESDQNTIISWLLVLAELQSATALLFRDTAADVVQPDDVTSMAAAIRRRFEQFRRGERPRALNADGSFSRARQAELLLNALDRYQ